MKSSLKLLTYLKKMKGNPKNIKGRFVNILLCCMRMVNPIFLLITMILTNGQEESFSMIIKTFVVFSSIAVIDE